MCKKTSYKFVAEVEETPFWGLAHKSQKIYFTTSLSHTPKEL